MKTFISNWKWFCLPMINFLSWKCQYRTKFSKVLSVGKKPISLNYTVIFAYYYSIYYYQFVLLRHFQSMKPIWKIRFSKASQNFSDKLEPQISNFNGELFQFNTETTSNYLSSFNQILRHERKTKYILFLLEIEDLTVYRFTL